MSERNEDGRSKTWFKAGESGNPAGRPRGARNKLSEAFLEAVFKDFQKAAEEDATVGEKAIAAMRTDRPNEYARMIASILAKEVDATSKVNCQRS